jgi:hypothetical protein
MEMSINDELVDFTLSFAAIFEVSYSKRVAVLCKTQHISISLLIYFWMDTLVSCP